LPLNKTLVEADNRLRRLPLNKTLGVTTRIVKACIPTLPDDLDGPSVIADAGSFEVRAERDDVVLVEFIDLPDAIEWFDTHQLMYCRRQPDLVTIKVIRQATEGERRQFRVPLWIQGDLVPNCCGRAMFFVGQIDDDTICLESPVGAKKWWHDKASFYVFTCSQCLKSTAVGQQL